MGAACELEIATEELGGVTEDPGGGARGPARLLVPKERFLCPPPASFPSRSGSLKGAAEENREGASEARTMVGCYVLGYQRISSREGGSRCTGTGTGEIEEGEDPSDFFF
jgi:hypothetical protein